MGDLSIYSNGEKIQGKQIIFTLRELNEIHMPCLSSKIIVIYFSFVFTHVSTSLFVKRSQDIVLSFYIDVASNLIAFNL